LSANDDLPSDLPSALDNERVSPARLDSGPRLLALNAFAFAIPLVHAAMEPGLLGAKVLELAPDRPNFALGGLTFAGLTVAVIWQPIVGALSDRTRSRFGPRLPWMGLGVVLCAIAGAATVLAPALWLLIAAYCFVQLSTNTVQGPWQAVVPDEVPRAAHGRAAAVKSILEMIAAVAGRWATGEILSHSEWGSGARWLALALPIAGLLIAFSIAARSLRVRHVPSSHAGGVVDLVRDSLSILGKNRIFGLWFVNRLLFWGAFITVSAFLLFFVIDVLHMSREGAQAYVGRLSPILGGVLLVAVWIVGRLSDRIGRRPFLVIGGFVASIGTALLLVVRDPWTTAAAAALVGLACGLYMAASWALVTELVPATDAARTLGLANIATAGSSALVRLPAGALIDQVNRTLHNHSSGYLLVYALAALAFAASAIVALRFPVREKVAT
jgi:MFS family permease